MYDKYGAVTTHADATKKRCAELVVLDQEKGKMYILPVDTRQTEQNIPMLINTSQTNLMALQTRQLISCVVP